MSQSSPVMADSAESQADSTEDNSECCETKYIRDTVRALLILDHSKRPFKQTDVLAFLDRKPGRKMWTSIFQGAVERLKEFGLILCETNNNASSKSYFLISREFPLQLMRDADEKSEVADRTLLIIILSFIFMREKPVTDVDIWEHLQQLKICTPERTTHKYFGDIKKKLFTDFVGQLYLEKSVEKESKKIYIQWGERANAEVTKKSVLEFACFIGYKNLLQPKSLTSHYLKAMKDLDSQNN